MQWLHDTLARHYGIRVEGSVPLEDGHTNESFAVGPYVVRRSWRDKPAAQLAREEAVLAAVASLAVPRVVPTVAGARHVVVDGRAIHVFTRAAGRPGSRWLDPGDHARMRAATARLAELHRGLAVLAPAAPDWLVERLERVTARGTRGLPAGSAHALARIAEVLDGRPRGPAQWLHGDYHLGNLLWDDAHVAGIVDFDETGCGAAASELAMALFALARQHAGEDHFRYDAALWRAGLAAYNAAANTAIELDPGACELVFCAYQVLIHLEAVQRGSWTLAPGIGFWPCWHRLVT